MRALYAAEKIGVSAALFDQGLVREAIRPLRVALSLEPEIWASECLAELGEDHPYTGLSISLSGNRQLRDGRYGEALETLGKALNIQTKHHGEDSLEVASVQFSMALAYRELGFKGLAKGMFEPCWKTFARVHGPGHPHTKAALGELRKLH